MKYRLFASLAAAALLASACQQTYQSIGPNDIAMMLTPSGYENKIYTPGQVDIGDLQDNGRGNSLVLIQRSGIQVKESFTGPEANADKEDHRCLTGDGAPLTLDVRLLFALPDYNTPQGKADLERIFLLGNPKPVEGSGDRVLRISAATIYGEQAQQSVRGRIRQLCATFPNYNAAATAFADTSAKGLVSQISSAVGTVLKQNNVPLRLVSAYPSNMKPDQRVIDQIALRQATEIQIANINKLADAIGADPSGGRRLVYQMQSIQQITAKGGQNTIIIGPGGAAPMMMR